MDVTKVVGLLKSVLLMLAPQLKKKESVEGVKELREGIEGALELGLVLAERLKDGVGVDDLGALWNKWSTDQVLQQKLRAAVDGYKKIGAEVKDIDAGEGLELATSALDYLPRYVEALKKDPA